MAVYLNDGLTFGFDPWDEPLPLIHYCFRVGEDDFGAILCRLKATQIRYRSAVHGPVDFGIDTAHASFIGTNPTAAGRRCRRSVTRGRPERQVLGSTSRSGKRR